MLAWPQARRRWATLVIVCLTTVLTIARADADDRDVTDLSLTELMDIEVSSVSKRPEKRSLAPAALYVITQEDIRRSGATSIPEALRLAPGVHVARIDSNKWAISIRGFSGQFTAKLLVLIDGRSVYSPLFGGVFWEVQDTMIEDIDRIEVIRGPGGALWGANAVNGVINIITRRASETQGGLMTVGGGGEERAFARMRYGGRVGDRLFYRIYGSAFQRDDGAGALHSYDAWQMARGGFRADWQATDSDAVTVQGDIYGGELGVLNGSEKAEADVSGGNLLAKYERQWEHAGETSGLAFYDRTSRDDTAFREDRDTFDIDFQHRLPKFWWQELTIGFEYRVTADDFLARGHIGVVPTSQTDHLVGAFVQSEITLLPEKLILTLGSKLEHNDYTDFEVQPSVRLVWTPWSPHVFWAAVSRGVRTPARFEPGVTYNVPFGEGIVASLRGNPNQKSEDLLAFELGYRTRLFERVFVDVTGFFNRYDDLRSLIVDRLRFEGDPPVLTAPIRLGNAADGDVYGVEIATVWQVMPWCRAQASYSFLETDLSPQLDAAALGGLAPADLDNPFDGPGPQHQASSRLSFEPWKNVELDLLGRYVDAIAERSAEAYVTVDARLAYTFDAVTLSLVGQNLAQGSHREFADPLLGSRTTKVERGVYGAVTWRF